MTAAKRPGPIATLLACSTALLISGCQTVAFSVLNTGHGELPAAETVTFDQKLDLKLDVHRPKPESKKPPIAVFFYGGSWRSGNRGEYAFVGEALAAKGILAVIPDYRVFPQGRFPDFEYDAAHAVRWVFDHAAELGGDPQRIFLVGHSAGAHIAALLGTDKRYLESVNLAPADLAGVVGIAGPYDFLPLTDPDLVEVFGEEQDWPTSQPVNFVDGDEPPFLLIHGLGDRIVWPRNSRSLQSKLQEVDVPVELISYPGVGHFRIAAAIRFHSLAPTLEDTASYILKSNR
ncbi:MAG TPA: alpha/beta hydrolase [Dokdonella sp.]|uniref:alpha/beta hydrolase n=1 Tax=Dokdonella sp. TaxID=2291710 RepID=UPI002D7E45EC|nr:alpha/beta hydrolase [Dokdonella sp.]HET9032462.1 alpha/beta hydrolase [Dokdonella sp.]